MAPQASAPESLPDAALRLEALLGQHAVLAADMMRGRLRNDEDFAQAANAAIGQNTEELAQLVGALLGEQQAGQFRGLWAEHVTALFNYSRGLATDDAAVRDEARAKLVGFETEIADFFAAASQGRLDPRGGPGGGDHARRSPDAAGGRVRGGGLRAGQQQLPGGLPAHLRAG